MRYAVNPDLTEWEEYHETRPPREGGMCPWWWDFAKVLDKPDQPDDTDWDKAWRDGKESSYMPDQVAYTPKATYHGGPIYFRTPAHLLGSVGGGWDRDRELHLTRIRTEDENGDILTYSVRVDPRFGAHAPRVMELCQRLQTVRYDVNERTGQDMPDYHDLDDATANALDWLYHKLPHAGSDHIEIIGVRGDNGKYAGKSTSHWRKGTRADFVCKTVDNHLQDRTREEDAFRYERVRDGDGGRRWTNGGCEQTITNPIGEADDDDPDALAPEWDYYLPSDPRLGGGDYDDVIVMRDSVKTLGYPRRELIADLHKLVVTGAEWDDLLDHTSKYTGLTDILDRISLVIDVNPSIIIDDAGINRSLRQVGIELGISYGTVRNRLIAYQKLWNEKASGWTWRPTSAELKQARKGASGKQGITGTAGKWFGSTSAVDGITATSGLTGRMGGRRLGDHVEYDAGRVEVSHGTFTPRGRRGFTTPAGLLAIASELDFNSGQ